MLKILGLKLLQIIPVLLLVTLFTTVMLDFIPGDPAVVIAGEEATPQQLATIRHDLGLDRPLLDRYADWLGNAATGDFGGSALTHQPVSESLSERVPVTLELAVLAMVMGLLAAIPAGVFAAYRTDRAFDRAGNATAAVLLASPAFMTGLFLAYLFAVQWQIFPATGWVPLDENVVDNLEHAFLPSFTLALGLFAVFYRLVRSDMQSILREEYIGAANARGLPARYVLFRHALKPASFSLLTLAGLALGGLLGGAVLVEQLFALPGLGSLLIQAILTKDYVVVQGVVLFVTVVYVVVNAVVDVLYAYLDPRVRATV